jgi:hypothetical protein
MTNETNETNEDGVRRALAVYALFAAGAALYVVVTSGSLPERVATHFGGGGNANGWMSRAGYRVFMLGFAVGLPSALVWLVGWLPRVAPTMVNIPDRDYWLGPEQRAASLAFMARMACWFGCLMVAFMAAIHWSILRANAMAEPRLGNTEFLIILGGFLAAVGWWSFRMIRRFRRRPA